MSNIIRLADHRRATTTKTASKGPSEAPLSMLSRVVPYKAPEATKQGPNACFWAILAGLTTMVFLVAIMLDRLV